MKDKVVFWSGSDFIQLGLASTLKSIHDCELFCVYDVTDKLKKFFQEQKFVNFKKSWYFHDNIKKPKKSPDLNYLAEFEKKYAVDLWLLAYNERIFFNFNCFYKFSKEEILSILEQECRFFEEILDESQPDFLITPMSNLHHNHLFYLMCKARGIKILMMIPTRLSKRYMISNEPEKFDQFAIRNNEFESKTPEQLIDLLKVTSASNDSKKFANTFLSSKFQLLKASIQFLLFSNNSNTKTHYTYFGRTKLKVLFYTSWYILKKKYRTFFINKFFSKDISDEHFIFFPLQTEPERSLLIAAPFYTDQLNTIKHIAQSLPINYILYVKEHPTQIVREWRKTSFYKEIMNLSNVKLIHPSVSSENLLKKTSLVITTGGTVGFEAAFYRKPTLSFITSLYSELKSVYTVKKNDDLPNTIKLILEENLEYDDLNSYVTDLEKNSFELDMTDLEVFINENFFYGGFLVDVNIQEEKIVQFYEKFKRTFFTLANEHKNKILQYTDS